MVEMLQQHGEALHDSDRVAGQPVAAASLCGEPEPVAASSRGPFGVLWLLPFDGLLFLHAESGSHALGESLVLSPWGALLQHLEWQWLKERRVRRYKNRWPTQSLARHCRCLNFSTRALGADASLSRDQAASWGWGDNALCSGDSLVGRLREVTIRFPNPTSHCTANCYYCAGDVEAPVLFLQRRGLGPPRAQCLATWPCVSSTSQCGRWSDNGLASTAFSRGGSRRLQRCASHVSSLARRLEARGG